MTFRSWLELDLNMLVKWHFGSIAPPTIIQLISPAHYMTHMIEIRDLIKACQDPQKSLLDLSDKSTRKLTILEVIFAIFFATYLNELILKLLSFGHQHLSVCLEGICD